MIDSAADYDFVTGITNDEVIINGHIMPWRDYNYSPDFSPLIDKPECLRGEDICFLREGIYRRYAIGIYGTKNIWTYQPRVSQSNIRAQVFSQLQNQYTQNQQNPSFFTTTSFEQKTIARPSTTGYGYHPSDGYPELLMVNSMMVSQTSDWIGQKSLIGDNMRKLFYDFGRAKCQTYVPTYINNNLANGYQQTGQVEAGDSSIEWGTPAINPIIPSGNNRSNTLLFGEYHTSWKNSGKTFARSRQFSRTAPSSFTLDWNQSMFNFSDYATCTSALVFFWTVGMSNGSVSYYTNNVYDTQNMQAQWKTIPASLNNSTVYVSLSSLVSLGQDYARDVGVASQMFNNGRSLVAYTDASTFGTTYGIEVHCAIHPMFEFPDLDYSYWTWTPPQA